MGSTKKYYAYENEYKTMYIFLCLNMYCFLFEAEADHTQQQLFQYVLTNTIKIALSAYS